MRDESPAPADRPTPPRFRGFSFERFYEDNRRLLIWVVLGVLIWLLRSFFSLIFLTFVLAFVASPLADFFVRRLRMPRRAAICTTFGLFVVILASVTTFVVPQVTREAMTLVGNLPKTEERLLEMRRDVGARYPMVESMFMNYLRSTIPDSLMEDLSPELEADAKDPAVSVPPTLTETGEVRPPQEMGPGEREMLRAAKEDERIIHLFMKNQIAKLTASAPDMIRALWAGSATLLLALLFSFLISLDLVRLGAEVRNLRNSRLRDFYEETARPVVRFGYVVGRTIQAQAMVALVNTLLTLIGLSLLGVPSLTVLSLIVFLCSFIPVLGVFLSTVPIVLVAINSGGVNLAILAVLMVVVIHVIEAYLLNPMIYGKHLKINPVFVLIILFVGHHAFGVWGMLLGVPITHYFIHDVFGVPIWGERRLARKGRGDGENE
ncbi:MAG TPA: AI-2E family transporter [Bacteroidia bacterium]|nr:AI-2E family transporter [Bacteroidia bacterium]